MKKMIKTLSILAVAAIAITACKDKEPTIAKITVKDVNNKIVSGVTVILEGESTENPPKPVERIDTAKTDLFGIATFDYTEDYKLGQAGFAVLNIRAKAVDGSGTNLEGSGTIKIESETINEETVYIQ